MDELMISNHDIDLRVTVTGEGPVILCVPGWPELSSSWHHQVAYFAERGYRVAAMDVRGYGGSSVPPEVERYTLRELAGDVAAVAAALDDEPIVLFGHDWGAPIVWNAAIRHPDRVRAVAGLSVPHIPASPVSIIEILDQVYAGRFFYMLHFQEPGVAEEEFGVDLRAALKRVFFAISGDAPTNSWIADAPRGAPFLSLLSEPPEGPLSFLSDADLDALVDTFRRTGLTGSFNRYRAAALDGAASADIEGVKVGQPSCFVAGALDPVRAMIPGGDLYADPGAGCTDLRASTIISGAGHWVHQEAPAEVNTALEAFLAGL